METVLFYLKDVKTFYHFFNELQIACVFVKGHVSF